MKALVGAFNQEKALVGAFSVIVQLVVEPMDSFTALVPGLRHLVAGPGLPPLAAADPGVVLFHTLSDARVGGLPLRHLAVHRVFISVLLATL